MKMIIDNPYVCTKNGYYYLNAKIYVGVDCREVSYKVEETYKDALNSKKSDAFVLVLLYYALVNGYSIEWRTPCSEELIFQLSTYYIPILSAEIPFFKSIELIGPMTSDLTPNNGKGIATAISGGVDSTYSIYKYIGTGFKSKKLTHVIFTDCFIYGFSEEYKNNFYDYYLPEMAKEGKELGLDFIYIGCNVDEHFGIEPFVDKERGIINNYGLYTLKYCSLAYALANLISVYYFSSGQPAHDFSWVSKDTDSYDLFSMAMISSKDIQFYSSGSEVTRSQKVEQIADWKFAQQHLQVCAMRHDNNCGLCNKCIRTMSELYSFGKLDLFSGRFPVDDYLRNFSRRMGYLVWQAKTGHLDEEQLLNEMKEKRISIPFRSYFWSLFYSIKAGLRIVLKDNRCARLVYEKLNLGKFIYGDLYKYYKKL